jgi:N-acetylglucosamine-6-sulfatase
VRGSLLRSLLPVVLAAAVTIAPVVLLAGNDHAAIAAAPAPPNIIFILTDDQRIDTYQTQPNVRNQIRALGGNYRGIIPTSICCPSRASILTGNLAHTTGVYTNSLDYGGWPTFHESTFEEKTVAVALDDAGYRTGFMGKYLNYWNKAPEGWAPPGWDVFHGFWRDRGQGGGIYYNYEIHGTSEPRVYGHKPRDYSTTVIGRKAVRFIKSSPTGTPYFVFINPTNPHAPYTPAPRDEGSWTPKSRYDNPGVNETDMSDKPAHMQGLSTVPRKEINRAEVGTGESLRSVDRLVHKVLEAADLENTLVIYMSDNGVMWGDHRTKYKYRPYRFATEVPLFMRWDGVIAPGTKGVVANIDIAPTLLQAAGISSPWPMEGVSALPVSRDSVLVEGVDRGRPAYCGVRTQRYLFVEHATGERELYDYQKDPYELRNAAYKPAYATVASELRQQAIDDCVPTPPNFSWVGGVG